MIRIIYHSPHLFVAPRMIKDLVESIDETSEKVNEETEDDLDEEIDRLMDDSHEEEEEEEEVVDLEDGDALESKDAMGGDRCAAETAAQPMTNDKNGNDVLVDNNDQGESHQNHAQDEKEMMGEKQASTLTLICNIDTSNKLRTH